MRGRSVALRVEDLELVNSQIERHPTAHLLACMAAWIT
jgi:hypothetical protein